MAHWQLHTDPDSIHRDANLRNADWKCEDCGDENLTVWMQSEFDKVSQVDDPALATKLLSFRQAVHVSIAAFYTTYKEVQYYEDGLNHILTRRPEKQPRFEGRLVPDLMKRYQQLEWMLQQNRDSIMDAYNLFYFTYHLGKPVYAKGDPIRVRKDVSCSKFRMD